MVDALDRLKLTERTLVAFMGDHGYHLGERQWWNKNTLFEYSVRTPLIIAAPGGKPGVTRGLVEFVDLYPTIAELCGVKPPAGLAGQSLRPLLDDPSLPGKAAAFTVVTRGALERGDSIRTDRWRYTEWSDGTRELYDHSTDSEETRNVSEANAEIVKTLSQQVQALKVGQTSSVGKAQ
jgi:arylsulfatase A-like enzyme